MKHTPDGYYEGSYYPNGDLKGFGTSDGFEGHDTRVDFKLWRTIGGPEGFYLGMNRRLPDKLAKEIDRAIVEEINRTRKRVMSRSAYVKLR